MDTCWSCSSLYTWILKLLKVNYSILVCSCPVSYEPPFLWGKSGHLQTIIGSKFGRLRPPHLPSNHHSLAVADGATITFDVFEPPTLTADGQQVWAYIKYALSVDWIASGSQNIVEVPLKNIKLENILCVKLIRHNIQGHILKRISAIISCSLYSTVENGKQVTVYIMKMESKCCLQYI